MQPLVMHCSSALDELALAGKLKQHFITE
jgi:hypothetical protein